MILERETAGSLHVSWKINCFHSLSFLPKVSLQNSSAESSFCLYLMLNKTRMCLLQSEFSSAVTAGHCSPELSCLPLTSFFSGCFAGCVSGFWPLWCVACVHSCLCFSLFEARMSFPFLPWSVLMRVRHAHSPSRPVSWCWTIWTGVSLPIGSAPQQVSVPKIAVLWS